MRRPDASPSCSFWRRPRRLAAQVVVHDPAVTTRNTITAVLKEYLVDVAARAAQPAAADGSAAEHVHRPRQVSRSPDPPRWRTHDFENPSLPVRAGLQRRPELRRSGGHARTSTSASAVLDAAAARGACRPQRGAACTAPLATLDLADATAHRGDARHRADSASTGDANCPPSTRSSATSSIGSHEQSTTAVLDKISGARAHRRAPAAGAHPAAGRRRRAAARRQQARPRHRGRRDEHAARHLARSAGRERRVRRRDRRRAADLAPALRRDGDAMPPAALAQPACRPIQQAITDAADDLRAGVPPLRLPAVHRRSPRS